MTASPVAQHIADELAALTAGQPHLSEFMQELANACRRDTDEAARLYQGLQMWGGPGSFADQAGSDLPAEGSARTNELMIQLFEEFERHGIHYDRANMWIGAFRQWRDGNVFGEGAR